MRYLLLALFLLPMAARADDVRSDHDVETMLTLISQEEEAGGNIKSIGLYGERSIYQITFDVWKCYTTEPFWKASSEPFLAHEVAHAHLVYLRDKLLARGLSPTMFNLAVAWNNGLSAALNGCSKKGNAYALRLQKLFESENIRRTTRRYQP